MKLVELLARELSEWPKGVHAFAQDQCADVYPWTGVPEYDDEQWITTDDCDVAMNSYISLDIDLAEDYAADIVTRAQWQAERDRQKGGEWKRARGSKPKYETETPQRMEVRHRDGDITKGWTSQSWNWSHNDGCPSADIMAWRIISQPQAEEVEAKRNAAKDVDVEYAFGAPDADMSNLDWKPMGKCKVSNIEFDSAETEEERAKDTTVGTLTYKVDINTGPAMQALNELSAKWDQVESPFKWRDTVNELDAYIEEFTREREALINRLALEGFALLPAMTPVMGVADIDMSDWRNWKDGDLITFTQESEADFTKGKQYVFESYESQDHEISIVADDIGDPNGWKPEFFEWHSRP